MLSLDCHFKGNRPSNWAAFQGQPGKYLFSEHFDPSSGIRKRRGAKTVEKPVGTARQKGANHRSAEPATAMRVAGAAYKVAPLPDEGDHVLDREDGTDFIRRKD
jgi:hypothetical protein